MTTKQPLPCQLGMAGLNFKHTRTDLCYRAVGGTHEKHKTFDDVMNDKVLNAQRLSLLNGEFPMPACSDCKMIEEHGGTSVRQRIKLSDKPNQWYLDNVDPKTGKMNKIHRIEFRFNNTCNYACRHCSPEYSTLWAKTFKKAPDLVNHVEYFKHVHETSYAQFVDMAGMIPYIEKLDDDEFLELEITGGEPFFQKEVWKFLEDIRPVSHKILLIITSNGSIPGKWKGYDLIELLRDYEMVTLQFSMDASKSFYNYFREGGDYDNVVKNVTSMTNKLKNLAVCPVITVSTFQAARMPEIFEDFKTFSRPSKFTVGEVTRPEQLNPMHLPKELKERYLAEWDEWYKDLSDVHKKHADRIGNFSNTMMRNAEGDPKQWDAFCKYTDRLDELFGKRVFDYFPEWEKYWTT